MKAIILALTGLLLCGCLDPRALQVEGDPEAEAGSAVAPGDPAAPAAGGGPPPAAQATIADVPAEIVEKSKALEEFPHLVEVENNIRATDPLTGYTDAIWATASRAELAAFQHNIQIHYAQYEKYPTFKEFMDYYTQAGVELKGTKPWQVYAYNPADGTIVILEDRIEKKRRFDEAGIEYTE